MQHARYPSISTLPARGLLARAALLAVLLLPAAFPAAQAVSVAKWRGGAAGAYSMTMDDFCADHIKGIQDYADTMFHNRGLTMAFGALVGDCDERDWEIARRMMSHGHELMNHSWTHACGKAGLDWCQPYWGPDKHALEIDQAGRVAEEKTGKKVRFYIFPYDEWEPAKIEHLKAKGYVGARAGAKGALTPADFRDGFQVNFDVNWPRNDPSRWQKQIWTLNGYIDEAVSKGGWAIRETHGVNDSSWGYLLPHELREHLDYAKAKVDLGLLWVAGPTEIIKYRKVEQTYRPSLVAEPERLEVAFGTPALDTTIYDAALTLTVTLPAGFPPGYQVYQRGKPIPFSRITVQGAAAVRFDAAPHRGPAVITANPLLPVSRGASARAPSLAYAPASGRVGWRLASPGAYEVALLSPDGRRLRTLARGSRPPGEYSLPLDRAGLRPGVYFLRAAQGAEATTLRILLAP